MALCDAFNASPAVEFGLLRHRMGQLSPSAGGVVQHLSQLVKDFIVKNANAHFPLHHLCMCYHFQLRRSYCAQIEKLKLNAL